MTVLRSHPCVAAANSGAFPPMSVFNPHSLPHDVGASFGAVHWVDTGMVKDEDGKSPVLTLWCVRGNVLKVIFHFFNDGLNSHGGFFQPELICGSVTQRWCARSLGKHRAEHLLSLRIYWYFFKADVS